MSRYYDSQVGRFINADSLEYLDPETIGGLNPYAYCGNNPVMGVDPMGTLSIILVAGLIGFGISFISSIISQAAEDGEVKLSVALIDGIFGGISGALSAMGLPALANVFIDVGLDVLNNILTTGIENDWKFSESDWALITISTVNTLAFSSLSATAKLGFDENFTPRANKDIKAINRKLSKNAYKNQRQVLNAQKTIHSYISQAFNGKVIAQYGVGLANDMLTSIIKGIVT
jgi:uncharacterized protein RhaS with RHS repeats